MKTRLPNQIFIPLICLPVRRSEGGKLNIKNSFQPVKETSTSSRSSVHAVCIHAFHHMKAWLWFLHICNNALSLPNVAPDCLLQTHQSSRRCFVSTPAALIHRPLCTEGTNRVCPRATKQLDTWAGARTAQVTWTRLSPACWLTLAPHKVLRYL